MKKLFLLLLLAFGLSESGISQTFRAYEWGNSKAYNGNAFAALDTPVHEDVFIVKTDKKIIATLGPKSLSYTIDSAIHNAKNSMLFKVTNDLNRKKYVIIILFLITNGTFVIYCNDGWKDTDKGEWAVAGIQMEDVTE